MFGCCEENQDKIRELENENNLLSHRIRERDETIYALEERNCNQYKRIDYLENLAGKITITPPNNDQELKEKIIFLETRLRMTENSHVTKVIDLKKQLDHANSRPFAYETVEIAKANKRIQELERFLDMKNEGMRKQQQKINDLQQNNNAINNSILGLKDQIAFADEYSHQRYSEGYNDGLKAGKAFQIANPKMGMPIECASRGTPFPNWLE